MISHDTMMWFLKEAYLWVWGAPFLILFFGSAIYLTIALRGLQFRYLPYAFKLAFGRQSKHAKGDISRYQSLMTALAATVGIGNIAGVATALTAGGPGALFWMWVTALLGMVTKYAESVLAVKYRIVDERGEMAGGPMYFIEHGLGWKKLAMTFAGFGCLVALGGGNMLQANSIADVMDGMFNINPWVTGVVLAILTGLTVLGGIRSIGIVAGYAVPFMAIFYMLGGFTILAANIDRIPAAAWSILQDAFSGTAIGGGFLGFATQNAIRVGLARGIMTSEAGLGTSSIASAAAKTNSPSEQGLVSMTGSFLTTVIMCTVTALVLQVTDATQMVDAMGVRLNGASMTVGAFQTVFDSWGGYLVSMALVFFGFTTIIGYAYYAEKCLEYLFGAKAVPFYRVVFVIFVVIGSVLHLEVVWMVSDIANGLMAYPNLIGLIALSGVVIKETQQYLDTFKKVPAKLSVVD
ncbi:MAG: sodium:alanine symporter family protein [Chlamydiales bacterium]|nr:sodium:alanine symporter family protein [Chlamydiales bacterium]